MSIPLIKKYLSCLFFLSLIFLFVLKIDLILCNFAVFQKIQQHIQEKDIDAGALFYTESEVAGECEFYFLQSNQPALDFAKGWQQKEHDKRN